MTESRVDVAGTPGMFACSKQGLREKDEDFVASDWDSGIKIGVLCDGLGGESSGEVASEVSAKTFIRSVFESRRSLGNKWQSEGARLAAYKIAVKRCHDEVNRIDPEAKSGTTLTAMVIWRAKWWRVKGDVVHIGDSRCYRIRGGDAEPLTEDHSVTGGMVKSGYIHIHQIPETAGSSSLTKNIGDSDESGPDVKSFTMRKNDAFLLCCDGVWGPLHDEEGFWLPAGHGSHQQMVEMVVEESLSRGSTDNCSALLVMPREWS